MSISITVAGADHTGDVIDFTYSVNQSSLDIEASFVSQSAFTMDDEVAFTEDGANVFTGKIRDVSSEILLGGTRLYTYHLSNPMEALKTKRWSANNVNGHYDYALVDSLLNAENISHSVIGTIAETAVQNDGWKDIPEWQAILSMALLSGWAINWKNGNLYFQKSDYSESGTQSISGSDTIDLKATITRDVANKAHLISRQDFYSVTASNSTSISQYGENPVETQTMFGNANNLDDAAIRIIDSNKDPVHHIEFDSNIRLDATQQVIATFSGDISDLSGQYTIEKEEHTYMEGSINHHYTLRQLIESTTAAGSYHNTQLIQKNDILNKAIGTNAFSNTPSDSALPDVQGVEGSGGSFTMPIDMTVSLVDYSITAEYAFDTDNSGGDNGYAKDLILSETTSKVTAGSLHEGDTVTQSKITVNSQPSLAAIELSVDRPIYADSEAKLELKSDSSPNMEANLFHPTGGITSNQDETKIFFRNGYITIKTVDVYGNCKLEIQQPTGNLAGNGTKILMDENGNLKFLDNDNNASITINSSGISISSGNKQITIPYETSDNINIIGSTDITGSITASATGSNVFTADEMHPRNGATADCNVVDNNGNGYILHFANGIFTGTG